MPAKPRFGKLPPRYRFALNPFPDVRWSRCPRCDKLMHERKFALLIAFMHPTLLTLGKTCRYCTPCEFIIAHKHELEEEIEIFCRKNPKVRGVQWMVIGTVDKKVWQRSLGGPAPSGDIMDHVSDIKRPMVLYDPRPVWVKVDRDTD
jgi:hypothetical protein